MLLTTLTLFIQQLHFCLKKIKNSRSSLTTNGINMSEIVASVEIDALAPQL